MPKSKLKGTVRNDISVIKSNTNGNDLIIGDIHGNKTALESVIQRLGEHDRLFLVGDLTDRGKDSPGVIKTIIDFQQKNPGRLHVIRGNHETMCLDSIAGLEILAKNLKEIGRKEKTVSLLDDISKKSNKDLEKQYGNKWEMVSNVAMHGSARNGGDWLVRLFRNELESGKITVNQENGKVTYHENSEIKMIKDFMNQLPYIIHAEGNKPFNVAHADMPFNDNELQKRIKNKTFSLTAEEKIYATWAREGSKNNPIQNSGRNNLSTTTYVGHSIIAYGGTPVVRRTNTIDLDIEASTKNCFLVANHTQGKCDFIGISPDVEKEARENKHLKKANGELDQYFDVQKKLSAFLEDIKQCETVKSYATKLHEWSNKLNQAKLPHQYAFSIDKLGKYAIENKALSENLTKKLTNPAKQRRLKNTLTNLRNKSNHPTTQEKKPTSPNPFSFFSAKREEAKKPIPTVSAEESVEKKRAL